MSFSAEYGMEEQGLFMGADGYPVDRYGNPVDLLGDFSVSEEDSVDMDARWGLPGVDGQSMEALEEVTSFQKDDMEVQGGFTGAGQDGMGVPDDLTGVGAQFNDGANWVGHFFAQDDAVDNSGLPVGAAPLQNQQVQSAAPTARLVVRQATGYVPAPNWPGMSLAQPPSGGPYGAVAAWSNGGSLTPRFYADAGEMGVSMRQVQMGNPGEAEVEQAPPQIQAHAQSCIPTWQPQEPDNEQQQGQEQQYAQASTSIEGGRKAGKKAVVKDGMVVLEDRRAAREWKNRLDYNQDNKSERAKFQNVTRKHDVEKCKEDEDKQWASVTEIARAILGSRIHDVEEIQLASHLSVPYVSRVQPNAASKSANTVAKWKSEDKKRKNRFESWQLARHVASLAGIDGPTYGAKTKAVLCEDWKRGLASLNIHKDNGMRGPAP